MNKALLIGINRYPDAPLRGCLNDVETMHGILTSKFGFPPDNIRVLTDERATKDAILTRMDWLINGSKSGDVLVMHYSGHGSQVRDRNGDELWDNLDEMLCPYDLDWDNPLSDDVLADRLSKVPVGVAMTMVLDCCHSGTGTRNFAPPDSRKPIPKFLPPPLDIRLRSEGRILPVSRMGTMQDARGDQNMNHVLISGCKSNQTSTDAYIDGQYCGAMTWAFSKAVEHLNLGMTYQDFHADLLRIIKQAGFDQDPQLEGNADLLKRRVFGLHR